MKCKYDAGWAGVCNKEDCEDHKNIICKFCNRKAVKGCVYCYSIAVCGAPLCDKCKCNHCGVCGSKV